MPGALIRGTYLGWKLPTAPNTTLLTGQCPKWAAPVAEESHTTDSTE